jgi:hypothetical protein
MTGNIYGSVVQPQGGGDPVTGISIFSLTWYLFLLGGWLAGSLGVSPAASLVILLIGLLGVGSTGEEFFVSCAVGDLGVGGWIWFC